MLGAPQEPGLPADHRDQAGLGGLCLGQAVGVRLLAHPCPAAGLGAGFVLRGGAVGAQGALMLAVKRVC